ncbi:MAG: hypothetical protein GX945_15910 [Lentisphaerae bacterium]|nr:hypothetical protein [Lentisphaerota bacterium]
MSVKTSAPAVGRPPRYVENEKVLRRRILADYYSGSGLMKTNCCLLMLLLLPFAAAKGLELELFSDPPLPATDVIQNPGFEGNGFWLQGGFWRGKGEVEIVDDMARSGGHSLRFVGLSENAAGQMPSNEFTLRTDIPYRLDFWVRSYRETPTGGMVRLEYRSEGSDILPDGVDAQIVPLVKIPESWLRFSAPPKSVTAKTQMLFWQPRSKDERRRYNVIDDNIIVFPKSNFGDQDHIRGRMKIIASGLGVVWYDDISLRPLETWLTYRVRASGSASLQIVDKAGKVWLKEKFDGTRSGAILVPVDSAYRLEVTSASGEQSYVAYPE